MGTRIFILAETYSHYIAWLRNNVIGLECEFIYVRSSRDLKGHNNIKAIIIDGFHRRKDAREILDEIKYRLLVKG